MLVKMFRFDYLLLSCYLFYTKAKTKTHNRQIRTTCVLPLKKSSIKNKFNSRIIDSILLNLRSKLFFLSRKRPLLEEIKIKK